MSKRKQKSGSTWFQVTQAVRAVQLDEALVAGAGDWIVSCGGQLEVIDDERFKALYAEK